MIKLKNLKRNDAVGECDVYPEDSQQAGHIVVDLNSGSVNEYSLPSGYEWCLNHVNHAAENLVRLLKRDKVPNEYLVMWN